MPLCLWWKACPRDQGYWGIALRPPSRKPAIRFRRGLLNSDPWPQSCISEKLRAENSTSKARTGGTSQAPTDGCCINHGRDSHSNAVGTSVEVSCQQAQVLSAARKGARLKSLRRSDCDDAAGAWGAAVAAEDVVKVRRLPWQSGALHHLLGPHLRQSGWAISRRCG